MAARARKVALLLSLGAGFEYYDFIIYGMMAEHLSILFFASDLVWVNLIKAFAVFAVGYLARPFGGLFFGALGDTYGRKKVFFSVMLLMGSATFCIGLLPIYEQVGALAPCLLVLLRILQGLSFGAELPGAMTVVYEYAAEKRAGIYSSIVLASTSIGAMLASFVLYCLSHAILKEQILSWGWRIPFLFGGVLILVNYFIRRNLDETPDFIDWQGSGNVETEFTDPFYILLKEYKSRVVQGIGMTFFVSSLVITALYFPTYLTVYFRYNAAEVYLAILWSLIWSVIVLPICGWFADFVGKKRLLILTLLVFIGGAYPLFLLLDLHSFIALQLFMLLYQTLIALVSSCYFPLLGALFSTKVRYTGAAVCYNMTYSLLATLPIFLTALIRYTEAPMALVWVLAIFALISGVSILFPRVFSYFTRNE